MKSITILFLFLSIGCLPEYYWLVRPGPANSRGLLSYRSEPQNKNDNLEPSHFSHSFSPIEKKQEFQFFRNGKLVVQNDFSFSRKDKLAFKIANNDITIKFRIDSIQLTVIPDQHVQETRRQNSYWRRYTKSIILSAKNFEQEPVLQLNFESIYNKECTRMLVRVLGISEKSMNGKIVPSTRFTLGKEYSYWNFIRGN